MANHKSAIKRAKQSEAQRMRNRARKTRMKNVVKDVEQSLAGSSPELAVERLKLAVSVIDKTASKGVIHKNNAARQISRLTRRVNALTENAGLLIPSSAVSRTAIKRFQAFEAGLKGFFASCGTE